MSSELLADWMDAKSAGNEYGYFLPQSPLLRRPHGFMMNAARMKKCLDSGRTREQCMQEIYPERGGRKTKGSKKKPPPGRGDKAPTKRTY